MSRGGRGQGVVALRIATAPTIPYFAGCLAPSVRTPPSPWYGAAWHRIRVRWSRKTRSFPAPRATMHTRVAVGSFGSLSKRPALASGTLRAGKARAHPLDSWITVFLQEQRRAPASGADSNSSRAAPSAATRPRDDGMCMPSDRRVLSLVTRGYRGVPRCAMLLCPGEWPNGLREVGRGQVTRVRALQRTVLGTVER